MGGGGSQDSTVTNVTQVDPVTQAWRNSIMQAGGQLYSQGHPSAYPNSQVVPFSNQTQQGLDYLQNYAQQGAPNLQEANDANTRALSGWNPAMPMAQSAAQGGLSSNPWSSAFSQYGSGSNDYAHGMFQNAANDIGDAVNSQFAQAGRFGNNAARTDTMTRGIGNAWNQIMTPVYEAERNRGLQAQQTGASLFNAGQDRTLQGVGLFGDMTSQGNQDAQRSMALMPSLWNMGMQPGQAMLDIGGMYEGLAGQYLQDDVNRYNAPYQNAWNHLNNYAGLVSGLPDFSGSQSTSQGPGTNRVMSTLGGGMAGLGLYSGLSQAGLLGAGSSGIGWGLGGAGALLGLFSDRRLKREIEPLNADINGTPLYRYAYVWDEPGVHRIGVMADEAPARAVGLHASGYLLVDYAAL